LAVNESIGPGCVVAGGGPGGGVIAGGGPGGGVIAGGGPGGGVIAGGGPGGGVIAGGCPGGGVIAGGGPGGGVVAGGGGIGVGDIRHGDRASALACCLSEAGGGTFGGFGTLLGSCSGTSGGGATPCSDEGAWNSFKIMISLQGICRKLWTATEP